MKIMRNNCKYFIIGLLFMGMTLLSINSATAGFGGPILPKTYVTNIDSEWTLEGEAPYNPHIEIQIYDKTNTNLISVSLTSSTPPFENRQDMTSSSGYVLLDYSDLFFYRTSNKVIYMSFYYDGVVYYHCFQFATYKGYKLSVKYQ